MSDFETALWEARTERDSYLDTLCLLCKHLGISQKNDDWRAKLVDAVTVQGREKLSVMLAVAPLVSVVTLKTLHYSGQELANIARKLAEAFIYEATRPSDLVDACPGRQSKPDAGVLCAVRWSSAAGSSAAGSCTRPLGHEGLHKNGGLSWA